MVQFYLLIIIITLHLAHLSLVPPPALAIFCVCTSFHLFFLFGTYCTSFLDVAVRSLFVYVCLPHLIRFQPELMPHASHRFAVRGQEY